MNGSAEMDMPPLTPAGDEPIEEVPADFSDVYHFPPYGQLQADNHAGRPFYEPGEHWCLLAGIDEAKTSMRVPLALVARDRVGDRFVVGFDPQKDAPFDRRAFKAGCTVAIVYPKRFSFVDGTKGIRITDLGTCHAFPIKLDELIRINRQLSEYWSDMDDDDFATQKCHACGKQGAKLDKCGGCGYYYYCNAECQKVGWEDSDEKGHKHDCKVLKDPNTRALLEINTKGAEDGNLQFPFK